MGRDVDCQHLRLLRGCLKSVALEQRSDDLHCDDAIDAQATSTCLNLSDSFSWRVIVVHRELGLTRAVTARAIDVVDLVSVAT